MLRLHHLTRSTVVLDTNTAVVPGQRSGRTRSTKRTRSHEPRLATRLIPAIALVVALSLFTGPIDRGASANNSADIAPPAPTAVMPAPPTSAPPDTGPTLSAGEQRLVDWAMGVFEAADLRLPEVVVSFHTDTEACHGSVGRWERADGVPDRILVCTTHEKPNVQDEWRRRTLIHELAHAWAAAALDEATKERFVRLRGLTAWNDSSQQWAERGGEHAAEIISWGIIDRRVHFWSLPNKSCPAMAAGYYFLTGTEPPTGLEESCE